MHLLPFLVSPLALVLAPGCGAVAEDTVAGPAPAEPAASRAEPTKPEAGDQESFDHTHAAWTAVLAAHVKGDAFDYAALKEDRAAFDGYLASLHAVTPAELAGWTDAQRYAFWINVYNASTIALVVDRYPLESIRSLDRAFGLSSVFDREVIPMRAHHPEGDDDDLSLNDVEHEILRVRWQDARVHAAVNCASVGCPPLLAEAFQAKKLDDQLDAQMRAFVRDPDRNRLDRDAGRLRLSEIFKWFQEDFERDAGSVKAYLKRWLPEDTHAFVDDARVTYLDYSWKLNDVENP